MKPPQFDYEEPVTLDGALATLAERGPDAKVLAGGQSLIPLLNFRLAAPACLVDVNRLGDLSYVRRRDGHLMLGALTRQSFVERSALIAAGWPLLSEAVRHVAHPPIRNRGTVGGSVAHADPAAELPVVLTALGARYRARSLRGERVIESRDMFRSHLTTALDPDELLVEIEVPPLPSVTGSAFAELALRHGDFALGGAAVTVTLGPEGECRSATVVLLGAAPTPTRAPAAEEVLVGGRVDHPACDAAASAAMAGVQPPGDMHGSREYRLRVLRVLTARAIERAAARAEKERKAA